MNRIKRLIERQVSVLMNEAELLENFDFSSKSDPIPRFFDSLSGVVDESSLEGADVLELLNSKGGVLNLGQGGSRLRTLMDLNKNLDRIQSFEEEYARKINDPEGYYTGHFIGSQQMKGYDYAFIDHESDDQVYVFNGDGIIKAGIGAVLDIVNARYSRLENPDAATYDVNAITPAGVQDIISQHAEGSQGSENAEKLQSGEVLQNSDVVIGPASSPEIRSEIQEGGYSLEGLPQMPGNIPTNPKGDYVVIMVQNGAYERCDLSSAVAMADKWL